MPNKAAAEKYLRKSKKLVAKNNKQKTAIKDLAKKIVKALSAGETGNIVDLTRQFQKTVDKAVKSGWLKKNTAARKKSRLSAVVKKSLKK
ncbi:MAG: 30S ribosomal protein S20 [Candidatus Komeilibacteria bacterium]|nr:30S ribosomal protein S20 [Candidatus Komeilibacteria bacterium]